MCDVVGIGASILDSFMALDSYPAEDTKAEAADVFQQCGGPVGTGLVAVAKLGGSAAYLGTMSDDGSGRTMREDFEKYGVDTSRIVIKQGCLSPSAVVLTARDNASRTIVWSKGTTPAPTACEIPAEVVVGAKLLYLDGHHPAAALHACEIARENGTRVLLDAGSMLPDIEKILECVDILIASEEFACRFTAERAPRQAAAKLFDTYRPEVMVVTQGRCGGFFRAEDGWADYPAFPPPGGVVDTTGAGDVFHGAFAFAHLQDWPLERCVRFSSAVSALKCAKSGGRAGIPTYQETTDFLSHQ